MSEKVITVILRDKGDNYEVETKCEAGVSKTESAVIADNFVNIALGGLPMFAKLLLATEIKEKLMKTITKALDADDEPAENPH
jgi:hypothetical protein